MNATILILTHAFGSLFLIDGKFLATFGPATDANASKAGTAFEVNIVPVGLFKQNQLLEVNSQDANFAEACQFMAGEFNASTSPGVSIDVTAVGKVFEKALKAARRKAR